jgi:hypothetical protein
MAISTYSELLTAVANWAVRSDLTDRIPEFIALCEAKLNRELMCRQMEQRANASVDTATDEPEYVTLPSDLQVIRRISISGESGQPILQYLSPVQFNDMRYSLIGDTTGRPRYFTVIGQEAELLPVPDQDYELEIIYRKNIPALTSSNTTNWLLTLAPDVYLYGTLREAGIYMQEDERVPLWAQGYTNAVEGLNRLGLSASFNSGPIAMRAGGVTP